jgi:hypothetical protein
MTGQKMVLAPWIVMPSVGVADPGCLSRIRSFPIPDPGSRVKKIPRSASASKNISILTQKYVFQISEI